MDQKQTNAAAATPSTTDAVGPENISPKEVYEQTERYLKETESLIALLRESSAKGEEQLMSLRAFDLRAPQLSSAISPIDTAVIQGQIDEVRKHIATLEELRDRVKTDLGKVKEIGQKIADIMHQYKTGK
jgi:pyruvate/oxaloacetate carboxyltransferase